MNHKTLVAQSIEDLRLKTGVHNRVWGLGEADWKIDVDAGQIVFNAPNGVMAICPVQIIGTFNTEDSTWLWGWDHPSVPLELCAHAIRLRKFGEKNRKPEYVTRKLKTTEERCWEFVALACLLNDAQGAYRAPSGNTLVFTTFGRPRLSGVENGVEPPLVRTTPIVPPAAFSLKIPADVGEVVKGFIGALFQWEVDSYKATENDEYDETIDEFIRQKYRELIAQWCVDDVTPQGISFSSDPSHNPETERLVSAAIADDKCWVRTETQGTTYEYHLRRESGKWLLEHLYYVDDRGIKYECL